MITNAEESNSNREVKPKRLAITISGAVSLGSYEAGVLYEVLDAIQQHNTNERTINKPENRIVVDVLTGASAGGMTAIILAQKLLYEGTSFVGPYQNPLYDTWVSRIDLKQLQATKANEPALHSLLSSNLIERIADSALLHRYTPPGPPLKATSHGAVDGEMRLWVGVALSNLNGVDYGYRVEPQGLFEYREYADQMTRMVDPKDPDCDSREFWAPLHEAAVACGAFPIAFRPKDLKRSANGEPHDFPPMNLSRWEQDPRPFTYTDGGVLQNEPLGMAKNLVDLQDRHLLQDSRYYLFVSPHAKDEGPANDFGAKVADYVHLITRLAAVVIGQAGFRDWITAENMNDHIRLMDERARGLVQGVLAGLVDVAPLQQTAAALLTLLFPSDVPLQAPGARRAETRKQAEARIAQQYDSEMRTLRKIPNAATAFRDSMLAFETAAGLGARDEMRIYGITASASQLAGSGLQAFLGFFDKRFRDHDYDVGRTHAREVLQDPLLSGTGEIGPIYFTPTPIRSIDHNLDGLMFKDVPATDRNHFKVGLQRRVVQMVGEWKGGGFLRFPVRWFATWIVSGVVDWLAGV